MNSDRIRTIGRWECEKCEAEAELGDPPHEHWSMFTPLFGAYMSQERACPEVADFDPDDIGKWVACCFFNGAEDGPSETITAASREECAILVESLFEELVGEALELMGLPATTKKHADQEKQA